MQEVRWRKLSKALLEHEAKKILKDNGIPVLEEYFCTTLEEMLNAASTVGYPVVMKIVSPQIVHKSDAGGVKLNLKNERELSSAYAEMLDTIGANLPEAEIKGVLINHFVSGAKELIIGALEDPQFGPVLMIGLGGIFVEVFKDVSFGIAPISVAEAQEMLQSLQSYPIIKGIRGDKGLNTDEIAKLVVKVSEFILKYPVKELDLNPVFCYDDKVSVADARILMKAR